ncbi:hypothetical protein Bhyg_17697 [Pseudolycoriella hygida]|uniref:Uncharacterized protein n=1 Tax=Pseudolycoriella hygida TaxID=35572 RepID=A0A9Q0MMI1_9DIPT|nr:hypothetical protein Bhyg_17697 [Pseudolycoriella hygida]
MQAVNGENVNRTHSAQVATNLKYNVDFLKRLRENPLSNVCPDVVKRGIKENKGWTGSGGGVTDEEMNRPIIRNGTVFMRQMNPYNSRLRRPLVSFYKNNPTINDNNREMFKPIEPVGSSRFNPQSKSFPTGNPMPELANNSQNRNAVPDFTQRYRVAKRTSEAKNTLEDEKDEGEPEWYRSGPTSRNDCVDLHGFDNHANQENHAKNEQLGCADSNSSGGPTSGASSNNVSPQPKAKSTPAKNDSYRNNRSGLGRSNNWRNNFDNRQSGVPPLLNEFFKSFSGVQNQANMRGPQHFIHVEDVESAINYDKLRFRQMVANLNAQTMNRNRLYVQQEPVATATQILSEVEKIIRNSTEASYKRPEVFSLIKNIVESAIPPFNIMDLMTESYSRETIHTAVKIVTQAKQNAINALRVHPTESELKAHTEAIMQDAIIKKRLEKLSSDLLKSGRPLPNQIHFQQLLQQCVAGRLDNQAKNAQYQMADHGNNFVQENNLNRWFTPTLLNKGLSGELPQIPHDHLRSEELENLIKLKVNETDANHIYK